MATRKSWLVGVMACYTSFPQITARTGVQCGRTSATTTLKLRIRRPSGSRISIFKGPATLGINRAVWDLRRESFKEPPREGPRWFEPRGPHVLPGIYTATVKYKDHGVRGEIRVLADPRFSIARYDRKEKYDALIRAGKIRPG